MFQLLNSTVLPYFKATTKNVSACLTLNSSNISTDVPSSPDNRNRWTFFPVFSLVILISAIITNGTVLGIFAKQRNLCTPFNIYLINLLLANVMNMVTQVPIYLANILVGYWWTGTASCNLYLYGFIFQAGMGNAHSLITVNRLWAVLWPLGYRKYHNQRTAIALCGIMWVYVHVIKLAWLIPDAMYYRLPEEKFGCTLNRAKQPTWAVVHQFIGYNASAFLMMLAYPIICIKEYQRLKKKAVIQNAPPTTHMPLSQGAQSTDRPAPPPVLKIKARGSRGFLILTLVTTVVLVAWTPTLVYYTVILFKNVNWPEFQTISTVLWFVESVLDPVLFTFAVTGLRTEVRKLWKCVW